MIKQYIFQVKTVEVLNTSLFLREKLTMFSDIKPARKEYVLSGQTTASTKHLTIQVIAIEGL